MVNLQIHPQTALLFLIDALRATGKAYRLDLYIDATTLGSVLSVLDPTDLSAAPKQLYVENEIQILLGKFMQELQAEPTAPPSGEAVTSETGIEGALDAVPPAGEP